MKNQIKKLADEMDERAEGINAHDFVITHRALAILAAQNHQTSLESRLRTAMDTNGSPEFVLTWKEVDMRSGPPICALRASGRRKSDNGFIGVPTPRASMGEHMVCWARAESGEHRSQIEDFLACLGMAAGHLTRLGGANVCPLLCAAIMGFPPSFVGSAMRSFRNLQRNSSDLPSA